MTRRKKADRYQKIARSFSEEFADWDGAPLDREELALRLEKLLRREHQAVVRMVREEILHPIGNSERCEGWNQALECILELLNARAR